MAIDWTPSTAGGAGYTGTPEYRIDDDGTVHWRGALTLTSATAFTIYFFFPAIAQPIPAVTTLYVDYDPGGRAFIANTTECYLALQGGYSVGNVIELHPFSYQGTPPGGGITGDAIGGAISRDGQYSFNGILFNNALADVDALKVMKCEGLFDLPAFKGSSSELDDDHGGQVNRQLMSMRRIVMELTYLSSSKANMYLTTEEIAERLQPLDAVVPLYFRRAGVGTRFVNAKVSRFTGFTNDWSKEKGLSTATVEFICPDPRKLAAVQSNQQIVIPSGGTNNSGTINMLGNFRGGAKPILELAGPWTNPRISNGGDENRSLKLDMVIATGETLVIDFNARTILMGGVDHADKVRTDNQWWVLNPGNNLITATRSNTPANTATLTVKWWDSYA